MYLRELAEDDAPAMASILRVNRSFLEPWDPHRPESFFTVEGQREAIREGLADRDAGRSWAFGIFERSTGGMVGRIALSSIVRGAWQNANVGYWVARDRNGRGYCTEALSTAVTLAFDRLQLHRVQAAIMPRNGASLRVVEKNGFRMEGMARRYLLIDGVWEDHAIYARTRDDPHPPSVEPLRLPSGDHDRP